MSGYSLLKLSHLKKVIFLSLLSMVMVNYCNGQGKNFFVSKNEPSWIVKITQKNKRPSAKDVSEGYFLSFCENQNHVELQEDYSHVIREIVSDAGVQNGSQISVTYDPGFQKLTFHKVIIWRDGKPSDRLNSRSFKLLQTEKELSRFIYTGTYDAFMLLEDVRKGDRIEIAYTLKGFNPIFGKKYASLYYFEGSSVIGHTYNNVIFSNSRTLNFKNFNFDDQPKITVKNGVKMYEWENTLTRTHRTTDYEPSWYNPLRRTQLTEYKNWNEVVEWGLAVSSYPDLKTPLVTKKVAELKVKAGGDLKKYIELATRFVQNEIRYMGIEMGVYSHRPNSPEKILIQRYGDCKDKSLLLVKLLEAQGIQSHLVYADTYSTLKTDQYLPSPFVFNHVIVLVEYNNFKTWIDPTISYQRGKFDDFYAPDYGNVLVIKKGVNALEKIESRPFGKLVSELRFKLADTLTDAKTTFQVISKYTENYADEIRNQIAESGTDGLEKTYLEYYGKLYPEIEIKEPLAVKDDEADNVVEIIESYEIANIWTDNNDMTDKVVQFYGDLISSELRKITTKKRLAPLALKNPVNIEQNITIILPYPLPFNDEHFKIENDKYFFEIYRIQRFNEIKFNYTLRNNASYIENDKIKDYVKDVKKIDEHLTYYINRGRVETSAATGINFFTVIPYLFALLASAFVFIKCYFRKTDFDIERISDVLPIGGWLILIAFRMILMPIIILVSPFQSALFNSGLWANIANLGNMEFPLKGVFILESILFAVLVVYGIFCNVLFFHKRREFPKHFTLFCSIHLSFVILDLVVAYYINDSIGQVQTLTKDTNNAIGAFIYTVILIWYLTKSERVKRTFVFTYPKSEWQAALKDYYNRIFAKQEQPVAGNTEPGNENISLEAVEPVILQIPTLKNNNESI